MEKSPSQTLFDLGVDVRYLRRKYDNACEECKDTHLNIKEAEEELAHITNQLDEFNGDYIHQRCVLDDILTAGLEESIIIEEGEKYAHLYVSELDKIVNKEYVNRLAIGIDDSNWFDRHELVKITTVSDHRNNLFEMEGYHRYLLDVLYSDWAYKQTIRIWFLYTRHFSKHQRTIKDTQSLTDKNLRDRAVSAKHHKAVIQLDEDKLMLVNQLDEAKSNLIGLCNLLATQQFQKKCVSIKLSELIREDPPPHRPRLVSHKPTLKKVHFVRDTNV